jgi:CDP-4-dehydro-6-deoxyglucose reductase, E3
MEIFAKPQKYQAKIITKNQLTKTVYFVQYELITPKELDFVAGQTFMLTVAPDARRAMSIASPPQNKNIIDSMQDVSPMGVGSKWLLDRKVGDTVEMTAPLGRFVIDKESQHKNVMLATGTGIAPFRSMLLDSQSGLASQKEISLYWGLRYEDDIYLIDEINVLLLKYNNFKFNLVISKPAESWQGLRGHVTEHVMLSEKNLKNCDFYLCGNKAMITEMQEKLTASGVVKQQMKFDPFY